MRRSSSRPPSRATSRAFACDLDRTLIAEDARAPSAHAARSRRARARRRPRDRRHRPDVPLGAPVRLEAGIDDPVVCYQGAVVADPVTGEFLRHVPIPLRGAREVIDAVVAAGFHLNCYVDDELYVAEVTPEARAYADFQHLEIHAVGDLRAWLEGGRRSSSPSATPPRSTARGGAEAALRRPAVHLEVAAVLPRVRASGREQGRRPRSSSPSGSASRREQTVAFGDGENDRELLEWAGFGVAVANAHPRSCARRLVVPSVEEEGVAALLEAYLDSRRVIDLRAARNDPDEFRAALARKGAAEAFDAWLAADERWRALVPRVDELRGEARSSKGKPTPEQLEELPRVKEELQARRAGARRAEAERDAAGRASRTRPTTRRRTAFTDEDAVEIRRVGRAAAARPSRGSTPRSAGSTWSARRGSPARASATARRHGAPRARRSTGSRSTAPSPRARADAAARARARGGDVRDGLLPDRALEHLRDRERRAVPHRHLRGRARGLHMGEILERAAAPLRGVLDLLPPRGGRRRQGHARHVPRAPVQQGRDVLVHASRGVGATSTSGCSRSRRSSSQALGIPYRVVNVAAGDLGASAAKKYDIEALVPGPGALPRAHVDLEHDRLPGAPARRSATATAKSLEPAHTLNGTAVTDRALLAILENFQGGVPDVLRAYGAPATVTR